MITIKKGNIFDEDVEALVNSVNCVGVMGRGIALEFKNAFPDNYKAYREACKQNKVLPGRMFVYDTGRLDNPRYIINFPTKRHWRGKSRLEDIESGLRALVHEIIDRNIESIAIPPLGSDLGGLQWNDVRPLIEDALNNLPRLQAVVLEPGYTPQNARPNYSTDVPKMTPAQATLISLMHYYIVGSLDPFVTLLEMHKLMYFMQQSGEYLRFRFQKARYGPYAENMRHLLRGMEGHYIAGYINDGDTPGQEIELVPGAFEEAQAFLVGRPKTETRLMRVLELVRGFESPFGLELLATVHWITNEGSYVDEKEIVNRTYQWGSRKKQFTPEQIVLALDILTEKEWLPRYKEEDIGLSPFRSYDTDVAYSFGQLAAEWRYARRSGNVEELTSELPYQRIINLGFAVVPYILRDLMVRPEHWFVALNTITGENPVETDAEGNMAAMTEAWLEWGRTRGFIE